MVRARLGDGGENLFGMGLRRDALPGLRDGLVGSYQVGDALGIPSGSVGPVGLPHHAVDVAEQSIGKGELLSKCCVRGLIVKTDAKDGGVLGLKGLGVVTEPATLNPSTGSVGHRIEPKNNPTTPQLGERDGNAVVTGDGEFRSDASRFEHGASLGALGAERCCCKFPFDRTP